MATVDLSVFRNRVATNVLEAPQNLIDQQVLDACIEFCEKSNILRETSAEQTVNADQFLVNIYLTSNIKPVQVLRVWVDGDEIIPASEDEVGVFSFAQTVTGQTVVTGAPKFYVETAVGTVSLYPRPQLECKLITRCSVKPSRSATVVDKTLFENWCDAIVHGALSRLYAMKTSWQDPQRSALEEKEFKRAISNAVLESRRGRSRAEDMVTPVHI